VCAVAVCFAVLGAFGPWGKALGGLVTVNGTDGGKDGWFVLAAMAAATVGLVTWHRGRHWFPRATIVVAGAASAAICAFDWYDIETAGGAVVSAGWGLIVAGGASAAVSIAGMRLPVDHVMPELLHGRARGVFAAVIIGLFAAGLIAIALVGVLVDTEVVGGGTPDRARVFVNPRSSCTVSAGRVTVTIWLTNRESEAVTVRLRPALQYGRGKRRALPSLETKVPAQRQRRVVTTAAAPPGRLTYCTTEIDRGYGYVAGGVIPRRG
jgi:hypothetical protein